MAPPELRRRDVRTAWVLLLAAVIILVLAIVPSFIFGDYRVGLVVVGLGIVGFIALVIFGDILD